MTFLKRLLVTAFCVTSSLAAAVTPPEEWTKSVNEFRANLQKEFAPNTAKDLLVFQPLTSTFIAPNGTGSLEFASSPSAKDLASLRWDGKNDLVLTQSGQAPRTLVMTEKDTHLELALTKLGNGVAIEGFKRKKNPHITLFLYDSHRKGLAAIRELKVFAYDPAYKVSATYQPAAQVIDVVIPSTRGDARTWKRFGQLTFNIDGHEERIQVLQENDTAEELFLMFRDASNGRTTYGGGRYLNAKIGKPISKLSAGEQVTLDFNFAYSPMCARSSAFMCAIPQDRLSAAILAGEKKVH